MSRRHSKRSSTPSAISLYHIIPGPNGEFAGIVIASVDPEYFHTLLDSVRYAPDAWTYLAHGDGKLFMMVPERKDLMGKDLATADSFFTRHQQRPVGKCVCRPCRATPVCE